MYEVKFFDGDYPERQRKANDWGADVYVCHHFNAIENDNPETQQENATLVIVGSNASQRSIEFGKNYCLQVSTLFKTRNTGVIKRRRGERGDVCLRFTKMPAILVEPLFVSDVKQAGIAASEGGQRELGRLLADSIRDCFPDDEGRTVKIALSIGHKGKTSRPFDRGAAVVGHPGDSEAELSEKVLRHAARYLVTSGFDEDEPPSTVREQKIEFMIDGKRYAGKVYPVD
jgi:hypothetical protein